MENFKPQLEKKLPIKETENSVSYLGVKLEKAVNNTNAPKKEHYANFVEDDFSMALEQKIATAWLQGQPILIEGGTSIGKTTTVKKMCADLGYETHYINLTNSIDPETLMGRYLPNKDKKSENDPEYVFIDGDVTKGLREEDGKTKVIILDEYNSASPATLIRLHEVLDALERDATVTLSEDAGEILQANKQKTKVVALTNPPGKGYLERQPLDPAQLRRWVYQKEASSLPSDSFEKSLNVWAGFEDAKSQETKLPYTQSRDSVFKQEQTKEIPGLQQMFRKYTEFHFSCNKLLESRQIGLDQPQKFMFSDRDEAGRVLSYINNFYNGDITETFQNALRYYYVGKVFKQEDKDKLNELISHVFYREPVNTKRVGLNDDNTPDSTAPKASKIEAKTTLIEAKEIMGNLMLGKEEVRKVFNYEGEIPPIQFSKTELENAKRLNQMLVLQVPSMVKDLGGEQIPISLKNLKEKFPKSADGKTMFYNQDWYDKEDFILGTPKLGWKLTSKENIPNTTNNNYLEQTQNMVDYLKNEVFKDQLLPDIYISAIKQFENELSNLHSLIDSDSKKAGEMLEKLEITKLTRESPIEVLYRMILNDQNGQGNLLPSSYTWTGRLDSGGGFVPVGDFVGNGVSVYSDSPDRRDDVLGVSFSRSV